MHHYSRSAAVVVIALVTLGGCSATGGTSIESMRARYSETVTVESPTADPVMLHQRYAELAEDLSETVETLRSELEEQERLGSAEALMTMVRWRAGFWGNVAVARGGHAGATLEGPEAAGARARALLDDDALVVQMSRRDLVRLEMIEAASPYETAIVELEHFPRRGAGWAATRRLVLQMLETDRALEGVIERAEERVGRNDLILYRLAHYRWHVLSDTRAALARIDARARAEHHLPVEPYNSRATEFRLWTRGARSFVPSAAQVRAIGPIE